MKRNLLLLFVIFIMAITSQAQILITEISYNPPEDGQDSLEYIEFYNASSSDINLDGYYFTEGVKDTFSSVVIEANSYLVTANNAAAFESVFGFAPVEWKSGGLKNGGEDIELRDTEGNVVAFVDYDDNDPWPTEDDGTDGFGASIELCDLTSDYTQGNNWSVSQSGTGVFTTNDDGTFEIMGSPGAANTAVCNSDPTGDYTVIASGTSFDPADLTINVGETVLWDNQSGNHNVNGSLDAFPDNPEGFSSGAVAGAPWLFAHTFTIVGVYNYKCDPHANLGMTGTITVLGEPEPEYPVRDIATVGEEDADGVATYKDSLATLVGIAYGVNFRPSGLQFTLIDDNGNGIGVFSNSDNFGYTYAEGDKLSLQGKIGQYKGLTQIYLEGISLLSSDNSLLDPVIVTALDESTESRLVRIENLTLVDPSQWGEAGTGFNVDVTDGTNQYTLRIDNDVIIDQPTAAFNIIGIGGQYDGSSPYTEGYQLFPRYNEDLSIVFGTKYESGIGWINLGPNPAENILFVETEVVIDKYTILSVEGKVVQTGNFSDMIDLQNLNSGLYFLQLRNNNKVYSMRFVKQ